MKLSEYLASDNIFNELMEVGDIPIFNGSTNNQMNSILTMSHGDKPVASKVEKYTPREIAEILIIQHGDNWRRILDVSANGLTFGKRRTITETISSNEQRNNNRDDINKVVAFNSNDFINDGGLSSIGDENVVGDKTRTLTDETTDYKTQFNNLSINKKNNLIQIVVTDISNFLTLKIY